MSVKRTCSVIVGGVAWVLAAGCASQPADTTTASTPEPATAAAASVDFEGSKAASNRVLIQVQPDCTVDVEEAHISESKNEEAHWQLNGDPGPLAIEFKEARGRNALDIAAASGTAVRARIKMARQQGRHPYRIKIGDRECPDPVIIIDG